MEWMNRGNGQGHPAGQQTHAPAHTTTKANKGGLAFLNGIRFVQVGLLFAITILIIALTWFLALGGPAKSESSYVDKSKLQAVFLNGGQVYFGKINDLNGKFVSLNNIYYLRVNQQVQPNQGAAQNANDISLVKLGCELHGPQDSMLINREQVIFWENLKDDGQVAKAVKKYQDENKGEQKCEQSTNQSTGTDDSALPQNTADETPTTTPQTNNTPTTNNNRR